jgi:hypothetical protein
MQQNYMQMMNNSHIAVNQAPPPVPQHMSQFSGQNQQMSRHQNMHKMQHSLNSMNLMQLQQAYRQSTAGSKDINSKVDDLMNS